MREGMEEDEEDALSVTATPLRKSLMSSASSIFLQYSF